MLTRVALLVCSFALFACGGYEQQAPDHARDQRELAEAELARWEAELGAMNACWAELETLRWEVQPQAVLQARCGLAFELDGCMSYVDGAPVIATAAQPRTDAQLRALRVHELTHWLLVCSGVDVTADPEHTGAHWH